MRYILSMLIMVQVWIVCYAPYLNQYLYPLHQTQSILLSRPHIPHELSALEHHTALDVSVEDDSQSVHFECAYCQITQHGILSLTVPLVEIPLQTVQRWTYFFITYDRDFILSIYSFLRPYTRAPPLILLFL